MPSLQFYTKPYCPLCDEIREILEDCDFEWEEVNIESDTELMHLYKNEIPVVKSGFQVWFYRQNQTMPFRAWLTKIGNDID